MSEIAIVWTTNLKLEQYASQTGNLEIKGGPPVIVHKNKTGNVLTCKRNTEALTLNHCCLRKAISIAYSECAFVALVIHNVYNISYNGICGLSGSTTFFLVIS